MWPNIIELNNNRSHISSKSENERTFEEILNDVKPEKQKRDKFALYYGYGGCDKSFLISDNSKEKLSHFLIDHKYEDGFTYVILIDNDSSVFGLDKIEALRFLLA